MTACHLPPRGLRGVYRDDPAARAVYSEAAGIGRIVPAAVCVPADADDVIAIVRWARERSLPIVPRGSGTSMGGGAIGPGVIVDLSEINHIDEVDLNSRSVWVGPGALRGAVNEAASRRGLRFPVDPSSGRYCTIGGMVSTNAAGARTLLFGATRPWVLALDCVFDDGSRATVSRNKADPEGIPAIERFRTDARDAIAAAAGSAALRHDGVRKESSGYALDAYAASGDLIDLLVGSEGTLAVIVGVKLALLELPGATGGVLAAFSSLNDAMAAAVHARASGATACELLDRTFLDVAAGGESDTLVHDRVIALDDIPAGTEAVLLSEVEGTTTDTVTDAARTLAGAFSDAGASFTRIAVGTAEQHEIWELRHAASPVLSRLDPALKSMQFIEDGAVPPHHLAAYVRGVRQCLDARGIRGVIFGHAGDAHMHVNPLIDVSRAGWRDDVTAVLDDIVNLTSSLGGTLAGEHGDGRLRTPLLDRVWPDETRRLFALVKSAFDPRGLFNPGVKVPLAGQRPLGDIKYDPLLSPLPPAARAALDLVSAQRAYARPRLSLLGESD